MLLKVAAPRGKKTVLGMNHTAERVDPGAPPPIVYPWCRSCRAPVERFTIPEIIVGDWIPIDVQCHGKTQGRKVHAWEALRSNLKRAPIWFFEETRR